MAYSLAQAAKAVSRDRSTLLRMIKLGRISAVRDPVSGAWAIEPVELFRTYPPADPHGETQADAQPHTTAPLESTPQIAVLQARLDAAADAIRVRDDMIADLRTQRDRAHEERRQTQAKLDALLTDQRATPAPARRSWWPWGRRT
jgi:hypothetical protein